VRHALITNDFPPKVGGIQQYLYEIYRRLDPTSFLVITTSHPDARAFDATFPGEIVRLGPRLLPQPRTARQLHQLLDDRDIDGVVFDPLLPIGGLKGRLGRPYLAVAHGAEVRVPRLLPGAHKALGSVVSGARGIICAGWHPRHEIERLGTGTPLLEVPPGVDLARYRPVSSEARSALRAKHLHDPRSPLVVFASRMVPRKGADTLLAALTLLERPVELHLVGVGRDQGRLLGRIPPPPHRVVWHGAAPEATKIELYQAADLCVLPVRDRWMGLEQEGFGIVLIEAQACGTPVIAGCSGGTFEAVSPGAGSLLARPGPHELAQEIERWLAAPQAVQEARERATAFARRFDYDRLSMDYALAVQDLLGG
jgi:phosphatidylinositol alpha-1,6-mannosyltransferase